ncbi:hypothetical protein ACKVMT_02220 [Halobacteriales archaeon Cl-PHB]
MSERGEQPRADGQPTNQAQGGAQQGGYAGQAQAGAQESVGDILGRPKPKNYLQSIVGSMGVVGLLLGVGVFLVAEMGGWSLIPGAATAVSTQEVTTALSFSHKLTLAYVTNQLTIFLPFLMAPLFGGLVALRMDDSERAKFATSGVGVGAGALLFVIVVGFAASMVVPSVPQSLSQTGGFGTGAMAGSLNLGQVQFGKLIINGIMVAIPAGLAASATAYFLHGSFD